MSDYIDLPGFYPAGRLDHDSEGLLLLTDDGALQHHISHPHKKLAKSYLVQVEHVITPEAIQQLRTGVKLKDGISLPAKARSVSPPAWLWPRTPPVRFRASIPTSWLELTIYEGRNRQVRRMTAAVGFPTLRLIRYRIGDFSIDGIAPGEWIKITAPDNLVKEINVSHSLDSASHRCRNHRRKRPLPHGRRRK